MDSGGGGRRLSGRGLPRWRWCNAERDEGSEIARDGFIILDVTISNGASIAGSWLVGRYVDLEFATIHLFLSARFVSLDDEHGGRSCSKTRLEVLLVWRARANCKLVRDSDEFMVHAMLEVRDPPLLFEERRVNTLWNVVRCGAAAVVTDVIVALCMLFLLTRGGKDQFSQHGVCFSTLPANLNTGDFVQGKNGNIVTTSGFHAAPTSGKTLVLALMYASETMTEHGWRTCKGTLFAFLPSACP
ncbi:hypothetical protein R3P38DRAFT_3169931 [Favolaschia claudopus]|uniref:Uncharacterized protein n=1 Tax=Favolaschia claudopus TaxID=2862362 RepID=A0AAW0DTM7_9AGAR